MATAAATATSVALIVPVCQVRAAALTAPQLRVAGNRLVDAGGAVVHLNGVDRSGTEYACVQGWGIFDGPSDSASLGAMRAWGVNAVRIPLNEDCWLGINGVPAAYGGAAYRAAIEQYVTDLHSAGMVAILDLHWTAAGAALATGQQPMPDADHAPQFWSSVATAFGADRATVFDLFNEPYPDGNRDTVAAWTCWRDGGAACPGLTFTAAGMQALVTAVRTAGAANVLMIGGVEYANAMDQWLSYAPVDPQHDLAASFHMYGGNACATATCWDSTVQPLSTTVPVVTGEFGESYTGADCGTTLVTEFMSWADRAGISYLAWTWDTWGGCGTLVTDYAGSPTAFGSAVEAHYSALAASPTTSRQCGALSAHGPACPRSTAGAALVARVPLAPRQASAAGPAGVPRQTAALSLPVNAGTVRRAPADPAVAGGSAGGNADRASAAAAAGALPTATPASLPGPALLAVAGLIGAALATPAVRRRGSAGAVDAGGL